MRREPTLDVAEYVLAFRQGKEDGFDFFFREFYPALCYYANTFVHRPDLAEDIASEVFMKLWDRHGKFDSANAIRSFLYTSVRNACIDAIRHDQYVNSCRKELCYLSEEKTEETTLPQIMRAETYRQVHSALKTLPPRCRKVITMHYFERKSFREIADELNISPRTVENQKARGLFLLRKKLSNVLFLILF